MIAAELVQGRLPPPPPLISRFAAEVELLLLLTPLVFVSATNQTGFFFFVNLIANSPSNIINMMVVINGIVINKASNDIVIMQKGWVPFELAQ